MFGHPWLPPPPCLPVLAAQVRLGCKVLTGWITGDGAWPLPLSLCAVCWSRAAPVPTDMRGGLWAGAAPGGSSQSCVRKYLLSTYCI